MRKKKALLMLPALLLAMIFASSLTAQAIEGVNADNVKVKVYTKQGDDWFRARYMKTDSRGILEVENVLPGKYKAVVRESEQKSTQIIAAKFRMLDNDGRKIDEKTDVDVYMYVNDVKTLLGTWESDKKGWVSLSALYPDTEYALEIKKSNNMSLSSKDNKYRIKVKSKIDESNWFQSLYARTNESKVLKVKDVLPGYYKFKYKTKDATPADTFTLKMQLRDDNAEEIDEETAVEIYAYSGKMKMLVGTVMTDDEGWVVLPGVITDMKYKVRIK
jgi:5-hydroxyisourate hydrolase-like protein (transthyretin family)